MTVCMNHSKNQGRFDSNEHLQRQADVSVSLFQMGLYHVEQTNWAPTENWAPGDTKLVNLVLSRLIFCPLG